MANILTIAGSDPSGQVGIQGDLHVIRELGHRGLCAITTVTAQNDERVYSVNPVDTRVLVDQLRALLSQYKMDAVKIGLLGTKQIAYQVYRIVNEEHFPHVIVDPVLRSSSGSILLEDAALPILSSFLIPLTQLLTPQSLKNAKEIFITSTLKGVMPVARLEKQRLPTPIPGPITVQITEAYHKLIHR